MIYHLLKYLIAGHYGYENPLFRGTIAILIAFLVVWGLGPLMIRWLVRKKCGDVPDFDHAELNELTNHKKNVPTMGGLLILFGVTTAVLLLADLTVYYIHLAFFCMVWLGALGFWDDWFKLMAKGKSSRDGLKFYQKLLFQIGLGVVLGMFIYQRGQATFQGEENELFRALSLPFFKGDPAQPILLSWVTFSLITIVVVAGTSNAVNLTDGMDGLASGCVAMCCLVFMLLAFAVGDEDVAAYLQYTHIPRAGELSVLCGAMLGASLGFLWYNSNPAQVFMGDTGSLPLGGLIGFVAIVIRQELMLFIVGGVFVIEALSVMLQVGFFKLTGGKRLFLIAPIHHHFHLKGWKENQVVVRFWLLSALFAVIALATTKLR
ncbi:MAG: phospho-N-acetylmuramoyl-pentapeptide-transferase [Phycisphaerales bacterium]|nr:phospho-N-acetylmuramoyl-pentapeptide-transferase [Phycisphaerales bacterium]